MKKTLILVVAAAAAGGGWWYFSKKKNGGEEVRYASTAAFVKELAEYVETTGGVEPLNRIEIQPSSGGRIEKILVEEGRRVALGETLALMSSADRVAILDSARAMGEEQFNYWQEAYKPIKIISPIEGTVILKNVVEGQTVGANTVLFAISDRLIVAVGVDESDIGRVKTGQRAEITLDAYPDRPVKGVVFQILDEGKNQSNVITYTVKIRPDRVPEFFKSQMTANIKIRVTEPRPALFVPSRAVTLDASGATSVITALEKGKPVSKRVVTGLDDGELVQIVRGLEEGDEVFYRGRTYRPQKASGGNNPLMPQRPGSKMNQQQRRAMQGR
ncbi:MAG: efflux RND transporter periplasmic adaptor subunit [Elusimicrobiales bacterium]|jgi:macrolide-specific efflux system membrane fusion protein|nr:efflux RND transporter periplasmic adaptor subunit [Elusimicrobiales bacterium]